MKNVKELTIRSLEIKDLSDVAQIHKKAFPDSALTLLGNEAIRRYYEWQLNGPHQVVALGAFDGNEGVGFCFGGVFQGAVSGFLRKNRIYLGGQVLMHPWFLLNPLFRERFRRGAQILLRLMKRASPKSVKDAGLTDLTTKNSFGILALATHPASQRLGVGNALMREIEQIAHLRGFRQMDLTVSTENDKAIRFYERLHWKKNSSDQAWSGRMTKSLERSGL